MEQRVIRNLNFLEYGIYFVLNTIQASNPKSTLTLDYDYSDRSKFVKQNKFYLKRMVENAGFSDVFVAYWYFMNDKAYAYICVEHEVVKDWFFNYLYKKGLKT